MKISLLTFLGFIITALLLISLAEGSVCTVGGCGSGEDSWAASAQSFMSSDAPIVGVSQRTKIRRPAASE